MCLIHTAGQDDALDAMKDKVIIIASAEGLGQGSGKSQFFTCLFKMRNYRSILWDVISNKADIRCYLYSCTHFFCCLLKSPGKLIHQRQCFFMAVTADLAFAGTQFRDNVSSLATGNLSDIQRRIFIHLSLLDPADGKADCPDGMNALLRRKSCMRCFSMHLYGKGNERRCPKGCCSRCSAHVEYIGFFCLHLAEIKCIRTFNIQLLGNGEDHFDIPIGNLLFL